MKVIWANDAAEYHGRVCQIRAAVGVAQASAEAARHNVEAPDVIGARRKSDALGASMRATLSDATEGGRPRRCR
jgi:hypothetical protein